MSRPIELTFHGAAQTVTGSCMEVQANQHSMLVDCGLFQGSRSLETLNREPFAFDPARIVAVILTHAHIDHSGLLPRLVAEGFDGPIYCTDTTRALLTHMLPDAARIQEWDTERRNQRGDRAGEPPILPLYTSTDAEQTLSQIRPIARNEWFEPAPGVRARLWNAGHILGSCSVELSDGEQSVLFSGDIGPQEMSFLAAPEAPAGIDHVICESTYGDRDRADITLDQRRDLLEAEINQAFAHNGNLIIPVFAVERTQELLLDIASLITAGRLRNRPVFIDSPLASRITSVFSKYRDELEDMGGGPVFDHQAFHYVETPAESIRLHAMSGAIILAASGMCEGGRIRHHLLHNLSRSDSTILFVGYQAQGTLGRAILDGAHRVRISGQDVSVRARIRRIDSYSAHADRSELIAWIAARQPIAGSLFLTHGEAAAIDSLRTATTARSASVIAPSIGETYALSPATPARRLTTGRPDAQQIVGRDWQNDYAELAVDLKCRLERIDDAAVRREAVRRMGELLDSYAEHRHRPHPPARQRRDRQQRRA
jgi:metallo-beta-lactamase family protein